MDRPQGEGWWLASDGKWYPPESKTEPLPPPPPSVADSATESATVDIQIRPLSRGLTGTLAGFFWASAALFAISSVLWFVYWRAWDDWRELDTLRTVNDVVDAENAAFGSLGFASIAWLVVAVLLIIWSNLAYKSAMSRGVMGNQWSSGWAVGGWFIPFASLVIPKLVLNEVDRVSNDVANEASIGEPIDRFRWRTAPRSVVGDWWWALWVISVIGYWVGSTFVAFSEVGEDGYGYGLVVNAISYGALAASGVLGAVYVSRIGRRLRT